MLHNELKQQNRALWLFFCIFCFFLFYLLCFFFWVKKINTERADCPKTTYHFIALSLMHDGAVGVWEGRDWGGLISL